MNEKINIHLSYSWTEPNAQITEFIQRIHRETMFEIVDGNKDFNAGNDYFNLLTAALDKADFFICVLSNEELKSGKLSNELGATKLIENHNLKILQVNFNEKMANMFRVTQPDAIIFDFTRNLEEAFAELMQFIFRIQRVSIMNFVASEIVQEIPFVQLTSRVNEQLISYLASNPEELRKLESRKFEELIAELFHGFGYEVELTKRTRDGGMDIIAVKNTEVANKFLIECKRYAPQNKVSVQVVQKLYGIQRHHEATKAILATTSYFTKDSRSFLETHKWVLEGRDYDGIIQWINDYKKVRKI